MTGFIAKHAGDRAQIVRVAGGNTVTLKPGDALPVEPSPALDENLIAHYLARGVTFVPEASEQPKPVKKTAAEKAAEKAAAEEAAQLAAEQAAADKAAVEKAAQVAAAEKALDEAKALLATSGDDLVAKGEAEQMVAAAEAALAALQA